MWVRKPRPVTGAALDDVSHSLRVTECGFQRRRQLPCVAADRLGEAETLQEGEPAPLLTAVLLLAGVISRERTGRKDSVGTGQAEERPVELRELDPLYRARPARPDLRPGRPAEGLRGDRLAPLPNALLDVRGVEGQRATLVVAAPHEDVQMGVVGIMVIDRDPLESRPQVLLHPGDQRSRVGAEVEARRLLWGDDELEEPSVARGLPALQRLREIEVVAMRVEPPPLLARPLRALPGEIGPVGAPPRATASLRVRNLDGAALPPRHAAEEQRLAASPLAAAPKPASAVSAEKRVAPTAARSPQLDLQRKLLGRPTHARLPMATPLHRPPPSASTGRTV